jgi:hypothetical protein
MQFKSSGMHQHLEELMCDKLLALTLRSAVVFLVQALLRKYLPLAVVVGVVLLVLLFRKLLF